MVEEQKRRVVTSGFGDKEELSTKKWYLNFVKRICEIGGEQCGSMRK